MPLWINTRWLLLPALRAQWTNQHKMQKHNFQAKTLKRAEMVSDEGQHLKNFSSILRNGNITKNLQLAGLCLLKTFHDHQKPNGIESNALDH